MTLQSPRMPHAFEHVVTTEAQLREVLGHPSQLAVGKQIDHLDPHARAFIAASPFVLVGSANAAGLHDVSPKGDPAGFVRVLDAHTLAIPERPGNRRADTFANVLSHPQVGLLFLVPKRQDSLRVNGRAQLVRDAWLLDSMAVDGRKPAFALVVHVQEVFFHCAKCVVRSGLWNAAAWPDPAHLASLARAVIEQTNADRSVASLEKLLEDDVKNELY